MPSARPVALDRVLVVGGCGFLGHHVVRLLAEHHPSASISVLDLRITNELPNVSYHAGDVTSRSSVDAVLAETKPAVLINTVSPVHGLGKEVYFKVNVDGTRILLDAAQAAGVKAFVLTSSASVVFDGLSDIINANESAPIPKVALDPYMETKAIGEQMALEENRKGGMLTIALRLSGLFGEGDRQVVPGMLNVLKNNQTKFQLGDNSNLFDFTYIGNSAWAHVLAAEKLISYHSIPNFLSEEKEPFTCDGEAFNITNGEPVYFWDFPRRIWALKGHVASYHITMSRGVGIAVAAAAQGWAWLMGREPGFTPFRVKMSCWKRYFDIRKAKEMLGYQPIWGLDEGLVKTLKWFDEQERVAGEKKGQ